jgi:hypothetical protein
MSDGLASARLKLARAFEHVNTIKTCVANYAASDSYRVIPQKEGTDQISVTREPPAEISILAGEIVHQVRSALDYLVFDLIKLNPRNIVLPFGWETRCQFPLFTKVPRKGRLEEGLPGISPQALAFIESVQPYNASSVGNMGRLNTLKTLVKLSNIDKHRHLNIMVARVRKEELLTFDSTQQIGGWTIVDDKTVLDPVIGSEHPMGRVVNVERNFQTIVTFGEPTLSDIARMPVELVMLFCAYAVENSIVPPFEKFIQNP